MDISLPKFLALFLLYLANGTPDSRVDDLQVALSFSLGGEPSVYLQVKYDPVLVYRKPLPNGLCGQTFLNVIFINPEAPSLGCVNTFEHEMAHVWQGRTFGLLTPIPFYLFHEAFEPPYPASKTAAPYHQRLMGFSLVTFSIPLWPW